MIELEQLEPRDEHLVYENSQAIDQLLNLPRMVEQAHDKVVKRQMVVDEVKAHLKQVIANKRIAYRADSKSATEAEWKADADKDVDEATADLIRAQHNLSLWQGRESRLQDTMINVRKLWEKVGEKDGS